MPYIENESHRAVLDSVVAKYKMLLVQPGYLNYFLFKLALETCTNYTQHRNFKGELIEAILEIWRRQTVPYENTKIIKNGDIYKSSEKEKEG